MNPDKGLQKWWHRYHSQENDEQDKNLFSMGEQSMSMKIIIQQRLLEYLLAILWEQVLRYILGRHVGQGKMLSHLK